LLWLREQVEAAERGGADRFHIDVMDGVFVPNISFGLPIVEAMRRATHRPLEAHLMIEQPDRYIEEFAHAGIDLIIVHQEATTHLDRSIQHIKQLHTKAGVAICPATPVHTLDNVIDELDLVLVLTVNPGFGGQEFIGYTLHKIRQLRELLDARNPQCELEVDGGLEPHTIRAAYEAGANVFVAGTAVFEHEVGAEAAVQSLLTATRGARATMDSDPRNLLEVPMKILAIDVGGTHLKVQCTGVDEVRRVDSGLGMTAEKMVAAVKEMTHDWEFDVITIGYPGPVLHNKIAREPHNLGPGWVRQNFERAFGKPVKIINDAAMQALGSYEGGRMLFLGLGTGLGAALIVNGELQAVELGHLPYKNGKTFEDFVGVRALEHMGKRRWRKVVAEIVKELSEATETDYVVLGGGNARYLKELPPGCRLGANTNAFIGGFKVWTSTGGKQPSDVTVTGDIPPGRKTQLEFGGVQPDRAA
jgi:polyphosphate glucokinase